MIKNIIFDIGNIILEGHPSTCLKYIDIDAQSKKIIEEKLFNKSVWQELDYGYINLEEYYNKLKDTIPEHLRKESHEILINSHKIRKINNEIISLIKELYNNNYNIYILSDMNIDTYNYLKNTELNNYIKGWCISAVHHKTKKDNELLDVLIKEFNLNPKECYFIDDKEINIINANKIGMKGFTLDWNKNKYENLLEDMKNNNINH